MKLRLRTGHCAKAGSAGLAAVELALVLPLFLLLMMGTAELGRLLYEYNALTKAVRDAAQYLAQNMTPVGGTPFTAAQQATARNLVKTGSPVGGSSLYAGSLDDGDIVIEPLPSADDPTYVRVTATYTYPALFGIIPTFGLGAGDIDVPDQVAASVTMKGLR